MHRSVPRIAQRAILLSLFGSAMMLPVAGPAHAASACLYQSRSYSEGAFICVQKSLMQSCTADGGRMVWRIVADNDVSGRCTAPTAPVQSRNRAAHRTRIARQVIAPTQENSPKCFFFSGKRYCE